MATALIPMAQISIRFYGALNDFIAPSARNQTIIHRFNRKASIKDMIESFNVPHPEIEQILVNATEVNFDYIVQDGDNIAVYAFDACLTHPPEIRLRPETPQPPAFVVDGNLGKLVRYLRLLGFDCLYRNDYHDREVAEIAAVQQRTVLTRDRALLQRKTVVYGYFVRSDEPKAQTREVLQRFDLFRWIKPFSRCVRCNGLLAVVDKHSVAHRLQPLTRQFYDRFLRCSDCERIYWQGSHYARIKQLVGEFRTTY